MYLGSVKFYKHLIYFIIVTVLLLAMIGLGYLISLIMPKGSAKEAIKPNDEITVVDNTGQNTKGDDIGAVDNTDVDKTDDVKQEDSDSSEPEIDEEDKQKLQDVLKDADKVLNEKLDEPNNESNKNSEEPTLVDSFPNLYCESFEVKPTDAKTAYITFDDGPSENTEKILDILRRKNIKATFFVITGEYNSKNLELLKKLAEEGHTIGLHSHTHVYDTIYASKDAFLEDISKSSDVIYEKTNIRPSVVRLPGGSINGYNIDIYQDIIDELKNRNFQYYDWNVSFEDAKVSISVDEIVQSAMYGIEKNKDKNIIILAHDLVKNYATLEALEKVIDVLESYGYAFDKLDSSVEPITFLNKLEVNSNNK